MASKYRYRAARRIQKKDKQNFVITLIIIIALLYITFAWILPNLIGGLGIIKNFINPTKQISPEGNQIMLAPPVLNIPYEATNTAEIDIGGYAAPLSKVELFIDEEKKQNTDVNESGIFIFQNVTLNLGTNNIYGKTVDEKNIESLSSKTIIITFDNEKPDLEIKEPEDNKLIQGGDKKVRISGTTEPGASIFINGNQVVVENDGNFSTTLDINEGDNNFDIKAIDLANNISEISRKVIYNP